MGKSKKKVKKKSKKDKFNTGKVQAYVPRMPMPSPIDKALLVNQQWQMNYELEQANAEQRRAQIQALQKLFGSSAYKTQIFDQVQSKMSLDAETELTKHEADRVRLQATRNVQNLPEFQEVTEGLHQLRLQVEHMSKQNDLKLDEINHTVQANLMDHPDYLHRATELAVGETRNEHMRQVNAMKEQMSAEVARAQAQEDEENRKLLEEAERLKVKAESQKQINAAKEAELEEMRKMKVQMEEAKNLTKQIMEDFEHIRSHDFTHKIDMRRPLEYNVKLVGKRVEELKKELDDLGELRGLMDEGAETDESIQSMWSEIRATYPFIGYNDSLTTAKKKVEEQTGNRLQTLERTKKLYDSLTKMWKLSETYETIRPYVNVVVGGLPKSGECCRFD